MHQTAIFHGCKNENFQLNFFDNFHIFAQNIICGYTLEPPHNITVTIYYQHLQYDFLFFLCCSKIIKSNTTEYQRRRAFKIITKEAGRKSVQKNPDFGSYSTVCSVILHVS